MTWYVPEDAFRKAQADLFEDYVDEQTRRKPEAMRFHAAATAQAATAGLGDDQPDGEYDDLKGPSGDKYPAPYRPGRATGFQAEDTPFARAQQGPVDWPLPSWVPRPPSSLDEAIRNAGAWTMGMPQPNLSPVKDEEDARQRLDRIREDAMNLPRPLVGPGGLSLFDPRLMPPEMQAGKAGRISELAQLAEDTIKQVPLVDIAYAKLTEGHTPAHIVGPAGEWVSGAGKAVSPAEAIRQGELTAASIRAGVTPQALTELAAKFAASAPGQGASSPGAIARTADAAQPMRRFYHGTSTAFDRPDAMRFDPSGLFGPGYYLTSDPRVASSYAATARNESVIQATLRRNTVLQELEEAQSHGRPIADLQRELAHEDDILAALHASFGGPNVRAIDVPEGLHLLDAESGLSTAEAATLITRAVGRLDREGDDLGAASLARLQSTLQSYVRADGQVDTGRLVQEMMARAQHVPGAASSPGAAWEVQRAIADLGYDGIRYDGGKRIPLLADSGNPIEHEAVILFPESLPKIKNALSGTPMGTAGGPLAGIGTDDQGNITYNPELGALGLAAGMVAHKLPTKLAGAKPRSSYGNRRFTLTFESDVDKAAYIVSQAKPSKADADYLAFLRPWFPGTADEELRQLGRTVRDRIKTEAKGAEDGGTLTIPAMLKPQEPTVAAKAPALVDAAGTVARQLPQGLPGPIGAAAVATGSNPNAPYHFRYRLTELDSLIPSHTDQLARNPDFPGELQPRLRDRAESRAQIGQIAKNLNPDALLGDVGTLDRGPMIVGPDGVVESGNGRVLALRQARQDAPDRFQAYQSRLAEMAPKYGFTPDQVSEMRAPVLVRERVSDVDRPAFAAEANESAALGMAPIEQALLDAKRLPVEAVASIEVGASQSLDQALLSAANRPVVQSFAATVPANERAALTDESGVLNRAGLERLKAAIFAKTYPGDAGKRLTEAFFESLDPTVQSIKQGLHASLPAMAKAEGLIRTGARDTNLSIVDDMAKAVDMLARLRAAGMPVENFLAQTSMLGRELNPLQEKLLQYLSEMGRSPRLIREFLGDYAEAVIKSPNPQQGALFDLTGVGKGDILERITEAQRAKSGGPLFAEAVRQSAAAPEVGAQLEEPAARAAAPAASSHQLPAAEPAPQPGHAIPASPGGQSGGLQPGIGSVAASSLPSDLVGVPPAAKAPAPGKAAAHPPAPPGALPPAATTPAPPPTPKSRLAVLPTNAEMVARLTAAEPGGLVQRVLQAPGAKQVAAAIDPIRVAHTTVERIPKAFQAFQDIGAQISHQAMAYLAAVPLKGVEVRNMVFTRGVTALKPGASLAFGDVIEHPNEYTMVPNLRTWIATAHSLYDELAGEAIKQGVQLRQRQYQPGEHYFPRIVREVRDVLKRRGMDPNMSRHYDSMEAGMQAGVRYEDDPMAVAQLGFDTLIRKMVSKRMGDLVQPLGKTPLQLVDQSLHAAAIDTAKRLRNLTQAERLLKDLRRGMSAYTPVRMADGSVRQSLRPGLRATEAVIPGFVDDLTAALKLKKVDKTGGPTRGAALQDLLTQVTAAKTAAVADFKRAKSARAKALESARSSEWAEAARFGLPAGTIGVESIRQPFAAGRLFPRETADYLNSQFKREAIPLLRQLNDVSGVVRTLKTGFDFGTMALHLLPAAFYQPQAWARAAVMMGKGLADPRVTQEYLTRPDNQAILQKLIPHGLTLEGADYAEGGPLLARALGKLPMVGEAVGTAATQHVFSRTEALFQGPLNVAKLEMAKALLPQFERVGQLDELAALLNHLTGTASSRAAGLGANQRAIESALLFFSPRYTRSSFALLADAFKGGRQGQHARAALGGMLAGGLLTYTGLKASLGQPLAKENFDPSNPHFFEVELFGKRVSVGGFFPGFLRASASALATAATHPEKLATMSSQENPFIRYLAGRQAPAPGIAEHLISGRDFRNEPTNLAREVGQALTPLPIQDVWASPDESGLTLGGLALNLTGLRVNDKTAAMQRDELRARYAPEAEPGRAWDQISRADQYALEQQHPDLKAASDKAAAAGVRRGSLSAEYWDEVAKQRMPLEQEIARLGNALDQGAITGRRYRAEVQDREVQMARIPATLRATAKYQDVPITAQERQQAYGKVPPTHPIDQFLEAYHQIPDQMKDKATGATEPKAVIQARAALIAATPPEVAEKALGYVNRNRNPEYVKAGEQFREYLKIREDGYAEAGLGPEQVDAANKFTRQVLAVQRKFSTSQKVAAAAVMELNPDGADAWFVKRQIDQGRWGKLMRARQADYWQDDAHGALRKFYGDETPELAAVGQ